MTGRWKGEMKTPAIWGDERLKPEVYGESLEDIPSIPHVSEFSNSY